MTMTNREKIIEGLEKTKIVLTQAVDRGGEMSVIWAFHCLNHVTDALALLKEQEPVKPCVAVDTWICPKCGHTLESQHLIDDKDSPCVLVHDRYNFCPNCGRAVKWHS